MACFFKSSVISTWLGCSFLYAFHGKYIFCCCFKWLFFFIALHLCFPSAAVSSSSTPTPTGSAQQGQPAVAPPPPQYSYQEINVASLAGLAPHIQINAQVCVVSSESGKPAVITDWIVKKEVQRTTEKQIYKTQDTCYAF